MAWSRMNRWELLGLRVPAIMLMVMSTWGLTGCAADKEQGGPAATSDLVVDLQSLQPSVGGLSPSFHPADQSYTVTVGPNTPSVTLTAVTTDPRANLIINNQPAISGQPFGPIALNGVTTSIPIVVDAFGVTKDYQVTVRREVTADLQNLTASAGALSPAFDPKTLAYTVTTGFSTSSTTITATVADDTATLKINGSPTTSGVASSPIALNPGSTTILVEVTGSNGQKKTYQVTVIRGNTSDLANLQTSAGPIAPAFSPSVQSYTASTAFTTTQATITVTPADSTATITINNQAAQANQAAGPFNLNVGPNTFSIVVTAGSAGSKTYTLVITRTPADTDASLTNLVVSAGALNPGFDPTITNYVVNAPNSTTSTTVTATVAKSTSSLTINGSPATSGQAAGPFALNVGPNLVTVIVTAQSGATRQYQVTINRSGNGDANLTNLSVSAGPLNPGFNPNTTAYSLTVPFGTTSTTVTATVSANTSTLTINGSPAISGQAFGPITLNVGTTTIPVVVTAQDSSTKTYTVAITRQGATPPNLSNLVVSAGALNPDFTSNTTSYSVNNVPFTTSSTTVTATVASSGLTLTINGSSATSGQAFGPINLPVGTTNIPVVVMAQDGSTKTYTVAITRLSAFPPSLSNLVVSAGALTPVFNPNVTNYTVSVPFTTAQTTVTATVSAGLTLTINGSPASSGQAFGPINLPVGTITIPVVVTAQDGSIKTYTVAITRAAASTNNFLNNLTAARGGIIFLVPIPLAPSPFNPNTLSYLGIEECTTQVCLGSAVITATLADLTATLRINGVATASGVGRTVTLNQPGECFSGAATTVDTVIPVQVTAQNGTPRNYSVTIRISRICIG